ncbi:MAG TPA: tRNA (adenosine(37)-N6)-threonylcarbamoyltransferase complex ATPase subunit type 1 TsaE, partial [Desulfobacteraceae bacterium]|nr:tRNA (adenosine(37)-N6)-threonylcarbamoyltransferase complex ATPase subunit type 1 TsaE [Desulfobacteraceae bacterium]
VPPDIVISSPSFSLINEYEGMHTFFHIDTYRLTGLSDFLSVGLDEYFYKNGIVAMEWADRWPEILPAWSLKTKFSITDENSREIILSGFHTRALKILKGIK